MELGEQINQQRVKHIISSYQLDGDEGEPFFVYLDELFLAFPTPLIELAIVETLVSNWLTVPMVKGHSFLRQAHEQLKAWENQEIFSSIAPDQFQQITGLDPTPIFGPVGVSSSQTSVRPII